MNIGYHRNSKSFPYFTKYFQGLFITYSCKRIQTGTVSLTIRSFKHIGNTQFICYFHNTICYSESHFLSFDHTRTSQ